MSVLGAVFATQVLICLIQRQPSPMPGTSGGLELWRINDIPSYTASGTILSQEKGRV